MSPKNAEGKANSVDPDQTALLKEVNTRMNLMDQGMNGRMNGHKPICLHAKAGVTKSHLNNWNYRSWLSQQSFCC